MYSSIVELLLASDNVDPVKGSTFYKAIVLTTGLRHGICEAVARSR
jgi:hypothetical protein